MSERNLMTIGAWCCTLLGWFLATSGAIGAEQDVAMSNWGQWRGPLGTGVAPLADPPSQWSETENIRWKTKVPGLGHSTPIVWEDRLFVTTAIPVGEAMEPRPSTAPGAHDNHPVTHRHRFLALAIDRTNGEVLWQRELHEAVPHEQGHFTASLASNSPVTDGKLIFVSFGTFGLYALDFEGTVVWQKDLGRLDVKHGHGEGASPALHQGVLVVNCDHEGQSFVVAIDSATGRELWRTSRPEVTSWSSPLIIEHEGRAIVIINGTNRVRAYDLRSGEEIWQCGGLSQNVVATPVAGDGMVYVGSSYEITAMMGIRLSGSRGDITDSEQVVWKLDRGSPYVPSPLLYDNSLFFLRHYHGILTHLDAPSGEPKHPPLRLGPLREIYASPVAAAERIYFTDLDGATLVISHDDIPRPIAVNQLNDRFSASAALAGRELFLRGESHVYCIADDLHP